MPLPPALAARLANRGLIPKRPPVEEEEVFAEDYDDQRVPQKIIQKLPSISDEFTLSHDDIQSRIKGFPGCPNKYNIYHECSKFCLETYGDGQAAPDPKYAQQKALLLQKYPLPEGWQEVYDPGTGRCYYWNLVTDMVSWLPPGHPKHVASDPACVLREEVKLAESDEEDDSASEEEKSEDEEEIPKSVKKRQMFEKTYAKGRNKKRENDLDPMDPASYSEAPRGTWASGLMCEGNTGVDSTASGSLYQQRPLPSPGAILRAQKK